MALWNYTMLIGSHGYYNTDLNISSTMDSNTILTILQFFYYISTLPSTLLQNENTAINVANSQSKNLNKGKWSQ